VGKVVELRQTLQWFERKPLFGKGIVITRSEKQADDLSVLLEREGARVFPFPDDKDSNRRGIGEASMRH